jgi:hypothetical protein
MVVAMALQAQAAAAAAQRTPPLRAPLRSLRAARDDAACAALSEAGLLEVLTCVACAGHARLAARFADFTVAPETLALLRQVRAWRVLREAVSRASKCL